MNKWRQVIFVKARRFGKTRYMARLREVIGWRREVPDWDAVLPKPAFDKRFPPHFETAYSARFARVASSGHWQTVNFRTRLKDEIKFVLNPAGNIPELVRRVVNDLVDERDKSYAAAY